MTSERILVVDDDPDISEILLMYLRREGFQTVIANNGPEAIRLAAEQHFDLILLDVLLPELDGFEICRAIRRKTDTPIIFLSCKSEDLDIISGLGIGADDYVTKPFSPGQLMARIKAILRRSRSGRPRMLRFRELEIDTFNHRVKVRQQPVNLSSKEFQLLYLLAKHPGDVLTFDELYHTAWGADSHGDTRTLTVHMSNLRKKIERDPSKPQLIQTVRGIGYRLHVADA